MKKKRTPWFLCKDKPVRAGVYEFRAIWLERAPIYRTRFDGEKFLLVSRPKVRAADVALNHFPDRFEWRGLAEKP